MTAPRWISEPYGLSGASLKLWKTYARALYRDGFLKPESAEKLRTLVRLLALADAASVEIEREGVVLRDKSGAVRQHPAVKTLLAAQKAAQPLLIEFRLWRSR